MALLVLMVLAGLLRFLRLSVPEAIVFDETYYAKDGCLYVGLGQDFCSSPQATEQAWVHPPLGKWLIAGGIKIFGYEPFGWRMTAALFGTLLVALVYLLARELFRERWAGGVAGLLAATDFLLIVQSRIAMLDIFLAFFVVLGFLFITLDRQALLLHKEHLQIPFPDRPPDRNPEWRSAAGAAFGLAIAIKWSGVWALLAAGILALSWSLGIAIRRSRARADSADGGRDDWILRELALTLLALVALPLLVYATTYALWFVENGFDLKEFFALQDRMLDYHWTLKATHTYQSKAWTWPLVLRPVAYFYEGDPESSHIMAFGNPAVWWAAIPAGAYLAVRSLRRWRAERVVLVAWAVQYLAWVFVARPLFFFYMTPVAPFMMIALARALQKFRELGAWARWIVVLYLVLGIGVAMVWWYPVLAAVALPYKTWLARMLLKGRWI